MACGMCVVPASWCAQGDDSVVLCVIWRVLWYLSVRSDRCVVKCRWHGGDCECAPSCWSPWIPQTALSLRILIGGSVCCDDVSLSLYFSLFFLSKKDLLYKKGRAHPTVPFPNRFLLTKEDLFDSNVSTLSLLLYDQCSFVPIFNVYFVWIEHCQWGDAVGSSFVWREIGVGVHSFHLEESHGYFVLWGPFHLSFLCIYSILHTPYSFYVTFPTPFVLFHPLSSILNIYVLCAVLYSLSNNNNSVYCVLFCSPQIWTA